MLANVLHFLRPQSVLWILKYSYLANDRAIPYFGDVVGLRRKRCVVGCLWIAKQTYTKNDVILAVGGGCAVG